MSDNTHHLRNPESITTLNELEVAKRKAEINASHDRLLLTNNLSALRDQGPTVVLKNVVLPVVGIGVAVWGISKIVGSLTKDDQRSYFVEPYDEDIDLVKGKSRSRYAVPPRQYAGAAGVRNQRSNDSTNISDYAKYLPAALMIAKMGVGYWEKSGRRVPQVVHDFLAGPGVSSSQSR